MLGAVACRRVWPQGGVRADFRRGVKSLHFILYWPEEFQNIGYLKFCFAGWHSWNCGSVRTGRPLQNQGGLLLSLQEDLKVQPLMITHTLSRKYPL